MTNEPKSAVLIAGPEKVGRVRDALAARGIVAMPMVDAPAAFAAAASARVQLAIVENSPKAPDECRALRELSIPVILLTTATNVLEVNSMRKIANASMALPGTASDADLTAAASTLLAAPAASVAKTAMPQPPLNAVDRDPAFAIATACRERWNGILRIGERALLLLEGEPISSSSNLPGDRFGEILVKNKRATMEQVERALKFAQKKSGKIGASLVDMSVLTPADVATTLEQQSQARALAMFGPPTGPMKFTAQKAIRPDERRMSGVQLSSFVATGIRTHYDGKRLKALFPDTAVFKFTPGAAARFPDFRFTPAEAAALAQLDGRRTVAESAVRTSPLDFLRALHTGICLDLIRSAL